MKKETQLLICFLFLRLGDVSAQTAGGSRDGPLPRWLVGLVTGFLFLTFVAFVVKRAWCEGSAYRKTEPVGETELGNINTTLEAIRSKEQEESAYENLAMETFDEKITPM